MRTTVVFALLLVLFSLCNASFAEENWPQWRGPEQRGVASAGNYPVRFSPEENVAWKIALPGRGCSTPAVWGERIFVTCAIEDQDGVLCYDFDGQEVWRKQFGQQRAGKHRNGSGSNPSPVTDGEHLVVYYKSGTVACLDLQGNEKWQLNLQKKYGEDKLWWDLGTSPVLANGNAIIAVMNAGEGYLVALDLETGEVAWKTDRTYQTAVESDQAYTTPSVVESEGRKVIVTAGADHVTGHDAQSGELLWEYSDLNPENQGMWRMIASPVATEEAVVVPYGRGDFLVAVKLGGNGDVTDSHELWKKKLDGPDVPTPVAVDGRVIVLGDGGELTCLEVSSGDQLWQANLPRARAKYYASPVLAGNTLYCTREDGVIITCEVASDFSLIAENTINDRLIATPIPLRDQLLVRGEEHLYLFE